MQGRVCGWHEEVKALTSRTLPEPESSRTESERGEANAHTHTSVQLQARVRLRVGLLDSDRGMDCARFRFTRVFARVPFGSMSASSEQGVLFRFVVQQFCGAKAAVSVQYGALSVGSVYGFCIVHNGDVVQKRFVRCKCSRGGICVGVESEDLLRGILVSGRMVLNA